MAINVFVLLILRRHSESLNLRAALLHVVGDVAASAAVVIAGAVILLAGWLYIDPLLSLGIGVLIAFGAWRIVREAVNLLMEGAPADIDLAAVTGEHNHPHDHMVLTSSRPAPPRAEGSSAPPR